MILRKSGKVQEIEMRMQEIEKKPDFHASTIQHKSMNKQVKIREQYFRGLELPKNKKKQPIWACFSCDPLGLEPRTHNIKSVLLYQLELKESE